MASTTPTGTRLLTLVHISDLHFGVPSASEGGKPPKWWRHFTQFDGMLGHGEDALLHLDRFMRAMETEKPHLIVTGDLTACGREEEFERITQFLTGSIKLLGRDLGFGITDALSRSIPGNHDCWPGKQQIFGGPTKGFGKSFTALPIAPVSIPLTNGRSVKILGINSDSQVGAYTDERLLARGRFVDQLTKLTATAGPPEPDEIRVLLVHHSVLHKGKTLGIEDDSRRALWTFVKQRGVSVMLTGHVHVPGHELTPVTYKDKTWNVLEARCGTTLQIDDNPIEWEAEEAIPPDRLNRNSLLVHRLYDTGKEIEWWCERVTRTDYGFLSPRPEYLCEPLTVWPR